MYYLICTLIIMVFCIVALTSKNSIEGESFIPGPKPKVNVSAASQVIKNKSKLQFDQSKPYTEGRNIVAGVNRITLRCLPAHHWMAMHTRQVYNIHSSGMIEELLPNPLIYYTSLLRKGPIAISNHWSATFFQVSQNYQLKPPTVSAYVTALTMPATLIFVAANKSGAIRKITTSTSESYSLTLLRYNTLQASINNGTLSRKVLSVKYQKEKSVL